MPPRVRAEVLYTFEAAEECELSVAQGERVLLSTIDAPEGWLVVARALAPSEAGLVPASYIAEVEVVVAPAEPLAIALTDLVEIAAEDADLWWLADARHPDPDHQSRMLQAATIPWATSTDAAEYAGSGWFSGEAIYSFSDVQDDELAIEKGEPLYVRCDERCAEGWRHASRMDGSVGLVVSMPARPPARPSARPPALLPRALILASLRPPPLASLPIRHVWRQPESYVCLHDILLDAPVDFEGYGGEGSAGLLRFAAGEQLLVRVGVLSRGWWLARSAAGGPRGVVPRHLLDTWWRKEAGPHDNCAALVGPVPTQPDPCLLGLTLQAPGCATHPG